MKLETSSKREASSILNPIKQVKTRARATNQAENI